MSASSSRKSSPANNNGNGSNSQKSSIYSVRPAHPPNAMAAIILIGSYKIKLIMTPVNFTVFLVSLLLVELRYTLARSHSHPIANSRLPAWLHQLLYRPQPYSHIRNKHHQSRDRPEASANWYYHSKQKKLMKMEAAEAFEIRNTVLVLLGVSAAVFVGGCWYLASSLYRGLAAPQSISMMS